MADLAEGIVSGSYVGNGKQRIKAEACARIVLPFHPSLRRVDSLLAAVHPLFIEHGWPELILRVCWRLGGRSIARRMHKDSVIKLQQ